MKRLTGLLVAVLVGLASPAFADTYMGDFPVSALVDCKWNTNDQTGASITRSTDGTLKIYKNNSATERTSLAGVTQSEDFDAATGVHHIRIDTSDNTDAGFYAAGNEYFATMTAMTIDTKTVSAQICSFSIERANGILALIKARLPNATPGSAGGVFIAGTNAPVTITGSGAALTLSSTGGNGAGLSISGNGTGAGLSANGGATGPGLALVGGGTSGDGLKVTTTDGHGFNIAATGGSKHGITSTGGNSGTSDGIKGIAGTGGVPIRGDITGNLTGNVTGSVNSVSTRVTANTDQWAGTTIPAPTITGVPKVDPTHLLGTAISTPATAGVLDVNLKNIANAAVSTSTAQLGVNVVNWSGSAVASPNVAGVPKVDVVDWLGSAPNALTSGKVDALGIIRTNTAQAGGASTITLDSGASSTDNLYKNANLVILSGTGANQSNTISSYVGSSKVATMIATWATNPDNTSVFAIVPQGPISATVSGSVQVGGYDAGQSPGDLVLVTPSQKIATDASNRVQVQVGTSAGQLSTSSGAVIVQTGTGTGQLDLASGRLNNEELLALFDVRKKGTTSLREQVFIKDKRTGKGLTGLVFNSAGLSCYYWRDDQGNVGSTQITLAAGTRGSYTSGGFIEKDATNQPGEYELGIPDAALATGASSVAISCAGATNMVPTRTLIALVDATMNDIAAATVLRTAIAQGGTSTSITLDALAPSGTNYFKDNNVVISAGTGAGQSRLATAYNGSTKVLTVTPAWVTNPDSTSVFTVIPPAQVATTVSTSVIVAGYDPGQDPGTYVLVTPANKIGTDASNAIKVQSGTGANQLSLSSGRIGINWADILNTSSPQSFVATSINGVSVATALTNAPTNGDLTATMKTSVENAVWNAARSSHTGAGTFGQGTPTNAVGTGAIVAGSFASGAVDATAFAQGAADKVWATTTRALTDKAGFSLSSSQTFDLTGNITGNLSGSVGSVTAGVTVTTNNDKTGYTLTSGDKNTLVDLVWDEPTSGHGTAGTTGLALTSAASAGDPWSTAIPGAYGAGTAGNQLGNVVARMWDEAIAGHLTAGTTGKKLNDAASAGDPWGTTIPGAYGAGTAGKIVGDNINATVSSRAPESGGNVAAIKAKTDSLTFTTANKVDSTIQAAGDFAQAAADKVWASVTRSLTAAVSVGTNADKTGYSLTQAFPSNFANAVISIEGRTSPGGTMRKNVAGQRGFPIELRSSTDHLTPRTGLGAALTVTVYKDGATSPTTATGTVTEATNGLYWFTPSQADTNCDACVFHVAGTGADRYVFYFLTVP